MGSKYNNPNKLLKTAVRAQDRARLEAQLLARVPSPPSNHDLPFEQVKAMLRERLSALLMQDRARLRELFRRYDTHRHGMLTAPQMQQLLVDLGCQIGRADVQSLVNRFSDTKGKISFQDFCTNFLGLPEGFFSTDFAQMAKQSAKSNQDERGGKLPLPRGTSVGQVQRLFVNKMREQMFDVDAVISHALRRPNPRLVTMTKDDFWNVLRSHGCMVSRCQLDEIFNYLDHNLDSLLNYEEVACEMLGLKRPKAVRHQTPHRMERPQLAPSSQRVLNHLRVVCEKAAATPKKIYDMFRAYDVDGSGEIAYDEFDAMIKQVGCRVKGMNVAEELLKRFNSKGNGALSYVEFVTEVMKLQADALKKPGEEDGRPSSAEMLQSVAVGVKKYLMSDKEAVKRALSFFDHDKGGDISLKEFSDGIESLGLPMSRPQLKQLFREIDQDGSGEIDTAELAASVLGVDNGRVASITSQKQRQERPASRMGTPTSLSSVPRSLPAEGGKRPQTATVQTPMVPRPVPHTPLNGGRAGTPQSRMDTPQHQGRLSTPQHQGRLGTPQHQGRLGTPQQHSRLTTPKQQRLNTPQLPRPGTSMSTGSRRPATSKSTVRSFSSMGSHDSSKVQHLLDQTQKMRQVIQQVDTNHGKLTPLQLPATPGGGDELKELEALSHKLSGFASQLNNLSHQSRPSTSHSKQSLSSQRFGINTESFVGERPPVSVTEFM